MKTCTRCKQAKELSEFHNDLKCKNGKRSHCKACIKLANLAWQARNPEHARECWKKSYRKYYNPEFHHRKKLRGYGITESDYDSLMKFNSGKCHICDAILDKSTHIDHCHSTGKVRGMLCMKCNTAIGSMRDNPAFLIKASEYVRSGGFYNGSVVSTASTAPS